MADVQITVDLGTDLGLVDKINTVVGAFIADNADFSGSYSVSVCECTAPLKLGISVWWENSFNGAPEKPGRLDAGDHAFLALRDHMRESTSRGPRQRFVCFEACQLRPTVWSSGDQEGSG
jgi:hypothetical protein